MDGSSLQIRLLGSLALTYEGELCSLPSSSNVRSLLAYLIFHHDRLISRDRLAGIFWPDRPDDRARRALSQALWQARSALGPAADRLTAERQEVTFELRAKDRLDVAEFERFADDADLRSLEASADLYRADFLEGIYDDWALLERERLRECYLQVLGRLSALYKQRGDYERALVYAQRLVAADPLHEEAYCEAMRLYHLLGRSQAALEQFAALSALLEKEMSISPTLATLALYQEIVATMEKVVPPHLPAAPPPPPLLRGLAHLPLVGRAKERARLLRGLQTTIQGCGGHALIEGDAGVGKTRLVGEVVADARWRGFQVGLAKAEHLAAPGPYHLLREALSPLLTPLRVAQVSELVEPIWLAAAASVFPAVAEHLPDLDPLPHIDPQQERRRLWEGMRRCVMGLATISPLLLVLEDLQWADETTLAALPPLASNLSGGRAFVIFTARTAEARQRVAVWETLEALDRAVPLLRVDLQPFDSAETVTLVKRALGAAEADADSDVFGRRLQDKTGGNALFLVETLKSLLEQGSLTPSPVAGWRLPSADEPLPTPLSVHELIAGRLGRLDASLRNALDLIAVLGDDAAFPVAVRAGEAQAVELSAALEALKQRGFLVEAGAGYSFEHDQIRDVVYGALSSDRRLALHRRAGRALEASMPQRSESMAYHFSRGELWDEAVEYNKRAGDAARAVYANVEATAYYTKALEALDRCSGSPGPDLRFELHLAREKVYALQGEREAQREELDVLETLAEDQASVEQQAKVALRRAHYSEETGDYAAAVAAAQAAVPMAQSAGAAELEGEAFLEWGRGLWRQGEYPAACTRFEQALARAQDSALGRLKADAVNNLGNVCLYQGDYAQARTYFEQTLSLHRELGNRQGEGNALYNLGYVVHDLGDYATARSYYQRALDIYREIGFRRGEGTALMIYGILLMEMGNYVSALGHYEQSLQIFRDIDDREDEALTLANIGTILLALGIYDEVQPYFEQTLSIHREAGDRRGQGVTLNSLSMLFFLRGDNAAAEEYARQALTMLQQLGDRYYQASALTSLGRALEGLRRLAEAADAYRQALDIRRELDEPNLAMEPLAGLARAALARGGLDQALAYTEQIMSHLAGGNLNGTSEPVRVYLTCYRVLHALHDPRADEILGKAHGLLQERAAGIDDAEKRRSFLENVVSHRDLVAAFRQAQVCQVTVHLPRADVPTGRPLRDDEWVEVTWAVSAPEDDEIAGKVDRRRHRLLRLLRQAAEQRAAPTVADLAAALDAGERTVKRDLAALRAAGHDVRTRGS